MTADWRAGSICSLGAKSASSNSMYLVTVFAMTILRNLLIGYLREAFLCNDSPVDSTLAFASSEDSLGARTNVTLDSDAKFKLLIFFSMYTLKLLGETEEKKQKKACKYERRVNDYMTRNNKEQGTLHGYN